MAETPVVTCFLRNGADVLLLRRSGEVGSYADRWGGVAGHVADYREDTGDGSDGRPSRDATDAAARDEIAEETGLADAVTLVRRGDPFAVVDEDRGTRWLVHPYLFDCERRDVTTNYETATHEWVPATEILRRDTVPDLWRSYDAVRPTVETVRGDGTHGSAYISLRAVEVLRDEAGAVDAGLATGDWDALAERARDLRAARPGMTALRVRVDRAMANAADRTAAAVERAARGVLADAVDADRRAARTAADRLTGTVFTLSRSGTVRAAIDAGPVEAALLPESRPGGEGVAVAADLAADLDVTLTSDAAGPGLVDRADAVVVGADSVLPDGAVVNKVGTYPVALAAARAGVPVYAVCARDKVAPEADFAPDRAEESLYRGDADVAEENPLFEATPADLVTAVLTEDGALDADEVGAVAQAHRALGAWDPDREAQ